MKSPKQLERYFKGASNHHRLHILVFVYKNPGVTLENIQKSLMVISKRFPSTRKN